MQILNTKPKDFYLGTGDAALTGQYSLEKDPRNHTCKTAEMLVIQVGEEGLHLAKQKHHAIQRCGP